MNIRHHKRVFNVGELKSNKARVAEQRDSQLLQICLHEPPKPKETMIREFLWDLMGRIKIATVH